MADPFPVPEAPGAEPSTEPVPRPVDGANPADRSEAGANDGAERAGSGGSAGSEIGAGLEESSLS